MNPLHLTAELATSELDRYSARVERNVADCRAQIPLLAVITVSGTFVAGMSKLSRQTGHYERRETNRYGFAMRERVWVHHTPDDHRMAQHLIIASIFIGPILVAGLAGLCRAYQWYRIRKIAQVKLDLERRYEPEGVLGAGDVRKLLREVDHRARTELVAQMSFDQIGVAHGVIGKKPLMGMVSKASGEQHRLWQNILDLSLTHTSPLRVREFVSTDSVRRVAQQHPGFIQEIERMFRGKPDHLQALRHHREPVEMGEEDPILVTLRTRDGEDFILDSKFLARNSEYFRAMFQPPCAGTTGYIEAGEGQASLLGLDSSQLLKWMDLVSGKRVEAEGIGEAIGLASFFQSAPLLATLEGRILGDLERMSLEEQIDLACQCPQFSTFEARIADQVRSLRPDKSNWPILVKGAKLVQDHQTIFALRDFAIRQLHECLQNEMVDLRECRLWSGRITEQEWPLSGKLPPVTVRNFRAQHEIRDRQVHDGCLEFANTHPEVLRAALPWPIDQVPADVIDILFL